jgi:hypothetical protein
MDADGPAEPADTGEANERRCHVEGFLTGDLFSAGKTDGTDGRGLDLRSRKLEVAGECNVNSKIRAWIRTKAEESLVHDGKWDKELSPLRLDEWAKEAAVEFHDFWPRKCSTTELKRGQKKCYYKVAVVGGVQEVPYGQSVEKMPCYQCSLGHEQVNDPDQDQVLAFTVVVDDPTILKWIDRVEASVFDTNGDFTGIGKFDGLAIRLTKNITRALTVEVSYMHRGNALGPQAERGVENRLSFGFIYEHKGYTYWGEFIGLTHNELYTLGRFATTGGVARYFGPAELIAEATHISKSATQVGFGAQVAISKKVTIGPQISHTWVAPYLQGTGVTTPILSQGWQYGARLRVVFGNSEDFNPNGNWFQRRWRHQNHVAPPPPRTMMGGGN